ncbi:hypothetical protein ACFL1H_04975, partial [Nanoarchaeota archaeon]
MENLNEIMEEVKWDLALAFELKNPELEDILLRMKKAEKLDVNNVYKKVIEENREYIFDVHFRPPCF